MSGNMARHERVSPSFVCGLALVAISLSPLLIYHVFAIDWVNHAWLIGHMAAQLRTDGTFTYVIGTQYLEAGFLALYGFLFYPLAALPALVLGPDGAMRLIIIVLALLAYFSICRTVQQMTHSSLLAACIASVTLLAVYQLTNIYSRSAIPEAVSYYLQCILFAHLVAYFHAMSLASRRKWRFLNLMMVVLCGVLIVGTHPVSAYLTVFLLAIAAIVFLVTVPVRPERLDWLVVLGLGIVAVVIVLPWAVQLLQYRSQISIIPSNVIMIDGIDWTESRLNMFSADPRVTPATIGRVSTPYLEAPVNWLSLAIPLAIVIFIVKAGLPAWQYMPGVLAVLLVVGCYIGVTIGSIHAEWAEPIQVVLRVRQWASTLQFAYRLAGAANILGLLATLLSIALLVRLSISFQLVNRVWFRRLLIVIFAVSAVAGMLKVSRVLLFSQSNREIVMNIETVEANYASVLANHQTLPSTFYGIGDYVMRGLFTEADRASQSVEMKPVTLQYDRRTAMAQPVDISCDDSCLLRTNVLATQLLGVIHNGQWLQTRDMRHSDGFIVIIGESGQNVVRTAIPLPFWLVYNFRAVVFVVFLAMVCLLCAVRWRVKAAWRGVRLTADPHRLGPMPAASLGKRERLVMGLAAGVLLGVAGLWSLHIAARGLALSRGLDAAIEEDRALIYPRPLTERDVIQSAREQAP